MNNSEMRINQAPDGTIRIDVQLEDETVWLMHDHVAKLFGKVKKHPKHIRNIFEECEFDELGGCPEIPDNHPAWRHRCRE
jgi:hypothetical protein